MGEEKGQEGSKRSLKGYRHKTPHTRGVHVEKGVCILAAPDNGRRNATGN